MVCCCAHGYTPHRAIFHMADVIKRTIELEPELAFQKLDRALLKSPIGRIPELIMVFIHHD